MFFLGDVSHVKELFYFIDPVQEGFDVQVPTEGRNLDFYLVLAGAWVPSSPIWVRKRKSFSPVGICHTPRASPIGHHAVIRFVL